MREVKFQAWDKWEKEMLPVAGINFTNGFMWINELIDDETPANTRYLDEVVLRQYTGLKDKNDIEICDGDILHSQNNNYTSKISLIHEITGEVVVERGMTYLVGSIRHGHVSKEDDSIETGEYKALLLSEKLFEIIGNIYEDNHLLEVNSNE